MHAVGGILIALGVAVGIAAIVWWLAGGARRTTSAAGESVQGAGLADVTVAAGRLVITPRGIWKALSLARSVAVPLGDVAGCRADPQPRATHPVSLRVGGTGLPGGVRAGYMIGPDGRSWWLYRYGPNAIVIELTGNRLAYLVVEVDDPAATLDLIRRSTATAR